VFSGTSNTFQLLETLVRNQIKRMSDKNEIPERPRSASLPPELRRRATQYSDSADSTLAAQRNVDLGDNPDPLARLEQVLNRVESQLQQRSLGRLGPERQVSQAVESDYDSEVVINNDRRTGDEGDQLRDIGDDSDEIGRAHV
jgi:hypothetical protein